MRGILVLLHRWVGLAITGSLTVAALTGSLLAFYPELERWANPERYADRPPETWLPAGELAARLEAEEPRLRVLSIYLHYYDATVNATVAPRIDPATGRPFPLGYRRLALDPATGAVLARIAGSFAWSSVGMDLLDTVYTRATQAVFDYRPPWTEIRPLPRPLEQPRLG